MKTETNVFPILNLSELSAKYRLFDIRGLKKENYQGRQTLVNQLSRELKQPILIIEQEGKLKLVVKQDESILQLIKPERIIVGGSIYFTISEKVYDLDFTSRDPEIKKICERFLQFDLQGELKRNHQLWQPSSGRPFFSKHPIIDGEIATYPGFQVRVIEIPEGFGIVLDATLKFSCANPLPNYLSGEAFRKHYKGKTVIYRFGNDWYEIRLEDIEELNVSEYKIDRIPLIDFVRAKIQKPHPKILSELPIDATALTYYQGEKDKRAIAGLCYEVIDFQEIWDSRVKRRPIMDPFFRWEKILNYRDHYLNRLRLGNTSLQIARQPIRLDLKKFDFPSFELGNGYVLDANKFDSPKDLATKRFQCLQNRTIGFYSSDPLPEHFLVLPRSVYDSVGENFIQILSKTIHEMYPADTYQPKLITYEDKFRRGTDYWEIGKTIISAIESEYNGKERAYGVIMIPNLPKKSKKEHDKLTALLVRELEKQKLTCSTIHTEVVNASFEQQQDKKGQTYFQIRHNQQGRFNGYLKNVSNNKVLLSCRKYPYILTDPLFADLTIGIDVKHNTAGLTIMDRFAKKVKPILDTSKSKEKLGKEQLRRLIHKIINEHLETNPSDMLTNIVVHRDGKLYEQEKEGILEAIKLLKEEGVLSSNTSLDIIEIHKTSFVPFRLFGLSLDARKRIVNPEIGTYLIREASQDAFICTTGKEFSHGQGTTNPLYVKFCVGSTNKNNLLKDLFCLSTLAFTKPDDCSRIPMSLRINDIYLNNVASEYDEDEFKNQLDEIQLEEYHLN